MCRPPLHLFLSYMLSHLLQLLDEGADIHAIAPKRPSGGSALAEAIAGRHEALVEMLLRLVRGVCAGWLARLLALRT